MQLLGLPQLDQSDDGQIWPPVFGKFDIFTIRERLRQKKSVIQAFFLVAQETFFNNLNKKPFLIT